MEQLTESAVIVGLFFLRLAVPLGVTLLVTLWLHRLDTRWQAEAQVELIDQRLMGMGAGASLLFAAADPPCWVRRKCPEAERARCLAAQQPTLPCWLARFRQNGGLPRPCLGCALFTVREALERSNG